jgi:LuxR family maltose regulon positive regulatory protein
MAPEQTPTIRKICRPSSCEACPRERLFTRLDEALLRPAVWVTGPGGAGKTALVSSYLDIRSHPCIWYQLDSGDSDMATFFYFLGMAAGKTVPRWRNQLPLLTAEQLPTLPVFARRYFEALFASLPRPSVVVFDNCQDVKDSLFQEVMAEGLDTVPAGISVVLVSREGPPSRFARLLANGRLELLDWDQLRFTSAESAEFVKAKIRRELGEEMVQLLHQKSEGWVAGLVLMVEHAKRQGLIPSPDDGPTPNEVFQYFAAEVFAKMDEERQAFLLKTGVLPYLTIPLAEALTGNDQAQRILDELTRDHCFTTRRSTREGIYRYHQLFREFLAARALDIWGRDQTMRIVESAALLL